MSENELSYKIIGAAINVHSALGIGMMKQAYLDCLAHELQTKGFSVKCNVKLPLEYKGITVLEGCHIDLMVEDKIIVKPQTNFKISEEHVMQVLNQLNQNDLKLGIIINFNSKFLRGSAIRRVVNGYFD